MAKGQIMAQGTSSSLISDLGVTTIRFEQPTGVDLSTLCAIAGEDFILRDNIVSASVGSNVQEILLHLLTWSRSTGIVLAGLEVIRPTLNDVFLGATDGDE
jgi:ABC-type multidrug transport system ATPase subunit